jgi:hypothetical protein
MLNDYLQIRTLSIVFLGDFNPVIFHPSWLADKKLIREQESLDAKIELIHSELSRIDLGWVSLEVQRTRFEIRTSQLPYYEPTRDLCVSIFEILKETPIKGLGINHIMHYALKSQEDYYRFGNVLVPLEKWNGFLNDARLLQLEIHEKDRQDKQNGYYRIKIQPSEQKLKTPYGISININDHFSLKEGDPGRRGEILDILRKNWKKSFDRANSVTEEIWQMVFKNE